MRAREVCESGELQTNGWSERAMLFCNFARSINLSTEDVRGDIFRCEDRMRIVDGTEPASSSRIMGHATVALLQP